MNYRTRELEQALINYRNGTEQPPPGVDVEEAIGSIREVVEEALREEAAAFLESTKDLSKEDQLLSWRNWLFNSEGGIYPWRSDVYCEFDETPTLPSLPES